VRSTVHRHQCLQRRRFCVGSLASCIPRSSEDRSSSTFFIQVVRGRPGWSHLYPSIKNTLNYVIITLKISLTGRHRACTGPAAGPHIEGGWARKMAGSGRVSGPVAPLSKRRRAARQGGGEAIADRLWDAGYGRPQARRRTRPDHQPDISVIFLVPYRAD